MFTGFELYPRWVPLLYQAMQTQEMSFPLLLENNFPEKKRNTLALYGTN